MAKTSAQISKSYRLRNSEAVKARDRDRKRRATLRDKSENEREISSAVAVLEPPVQAVVSDGSDMADALFQWSEEVLKVPPIHQNQGRPFTLAPYLKSFLRDCLDPNVSEVALIISRKNSKTTAAAILLLWHLVGPRAEPGFSAGVVSLNRELAANLAKIMRRIAEASGLTGLKFLSHPRFHISSKFGEVEILAADRASGGGHGSSYSLALVDELGLLSPAERFRDLVSAMRSSVSARNGKFISLGIRGDSDFNKEILSRRGAEGLRIHEYVAPSGCAISDRAAWESANPALKAGTKSYKYMTKASERCRVVETDESRFRALDLNQEISPSRSLLLSLEAWKKCLTDSPPPRDGNCYLGIDPGSNTSLSTLAAVWSTGRAEVWGALPSEPPIKDRSRRDGNNYEAMISRGELRIYDGAVVPVGQFLADVAAEELANARVQVAGTDRYRKAEVAQFCAEARVGWPLEFRGIGRGPVADGSQDLKSFTRWALMGRLKMAPSHMVSASIADSEVIFDHLGNGALNRRRWNSRLDAVSALLIAVGLAESHGTKISPSWKYRGTFYLNVAPSRQS